MSTIDIHPNQMAQNCPFQVTFYHNAQESEIVNAPYFNLDPT
jgi:hypothetical protein